MNPEGKKASLQRRIAKLEVEEAWLRRRIARLRLILRYADEPQVLISLAELIAETHSRLELLQDITWQQAIQCRPPHAWGRA